MYPTLAASATRSAPTSCLSPCGVKRICSLPAGYGQIMADLKVRNLDDAVASTLKLRAWAKGCVARRGGTPDPRGFGHGALMRRAKALRAAAGDKRGKP